MAIDPTMLMAGANLADGTGGMPSGTSGIEALNIGNPRFRGTKYELPPLGLNVDNVLNDLDTSNYLSQSLSTDPNKKSEVEAEVNRLLDSNNVH